MAKQTKEQKCIELLEDLLNDHRFNPALMANMIITSYTQYTQGRLIELINFIYEYNEDENRLHGQIK